MSEIGQVSAVDAVEEGGRVMTDSDDVNVSQSQPNAGANGNVVFDKLQRVRRTSGMVGPLVTTRLLLHRLVPHGRVLPDRMAGVRAFDAEHGVETSAIVPPSDLGITGASAEHAVEYSPTAVNSFFFMMDRTGIDPSRYAFVDIGCGKGLVMLLASGLPFQKVVGVEASHQLCEVARSNIEAYESSSPRCTDLELYEGDALAYQMPEQDTVFYMCNPFGPVVLEQFLDRLEESLRKHPRHVLVVYDNPAPAHPVLDHHPVLRAVEKYETISYDYTWSYYENALHRRPTDEAQSVNAESVPAPPNRGFLDGSLVPFEPNLTPGSLFGGASGTPVPFPFDHDRVAYTVNGSAALFQAAEVLGLEAPDNVLCPAYNCGHEIEPFLSRGLGIKLFAVGDGLLIDTGDLRRQIDADTKAVLVVHYFGFPQPIDEIRAICDEHGLWLIEDCAHALYSAPGGTPLGSVGDVAVFSMRKTLPLPSGGALVVNTDRRQLDQDLQAPPTTATWNKALDRWLVALRARRALGSRTAAVSLAALLPLALARKVVKRLPFWGENAWYDTDGMDFHTDPEVYHWRMADLSRRLVERADPMHVRTRRRQNFEWLVDALDTNVVTPIHTDLPDGVCPWICPVVSDDPDTLSAALQAQGIDAWQFWLAAHDAVSWDEHPREMGLKRRIIALPIHQDLEPRQLRMIAEAIRSQR